MISPSPGLNSLCQILLYSSRRPVHSMFVSLKRSAKHQSRSFIVPSGVLLSFQILQVVYIEHQTGLDSEKRLSSWIQKCKHRLFPPHRLPGSLSISNQLGDLNFDFPPGSARCSYQQVQPECGKNRRGATSWPLSLKCLLVNTYHDMIRLVCERGKKRLQIS